MASADQLKALVKSHISRDDNQFYSVAMQVAAHEAKAGHGKLAEELRDMIDAARRAACSRRAWKARPVGTATRRTGQPAGFQLSQESPGRHGARSDGLRAVCSESSGATPACVFASMGFLRGRFCSWVRRDTGKTMTAAVLAGELGIPLFLVRLDALITKFMGETAAKLRQGLRPSRMSAGLFLRRVRRHRISAWIGQRRRRDPSRAQ